MQVENQVKPNVLESTTEEEAFKLLIMDYERRLKASERDRKDQEAKHVQEG
jgi:hypothetical protein